MSVVWFYDPFHEDSFKLEMFTVQAEVWQALSFAAKVITICHKLFLSFQ